MKKINVFPIIYSRTKNVDYVPDFLVRPSLIDYQSANKYIGSATKAIDITSPVRYLVFNVNDFVIYGMAGITSIIAEKVGAEQKDKPFLTDCKGRNITAFIGIAFMKNDLINLNEKCIPDVTDSMLWEIYVTYLSKQWNEPITFSDKQNVPEISVDTICTNTIKPDIVSVKDKCFIESSLFLNSKAEIIGYYINIISTSNNSNVSFISGIAKTYALEGCLFTDISAEKEIIEYYKNKKEVRKSNESKSNTNLPVTKSSQSSSIMETYQKSIQAAYTEPDNSQFDLNKGIDDGKKKTPACLFTVLITIAIVFLMIIIFL